MNMNILIVTHEISEQMLYTTLFKRHHCNVHCATNLPEAMQAISAHLPDAIICEYALFDRENSDGLLQHFRSTAELAYVPLFIIGSSSEYKHIRRVMELGADDYFLRPFPPEELWQSVSARVERFRDKQQWIKEYFKNMQSYFTRVIPHEFLTPFGIIVAATELLTNSPATLTFEDTKELQMTIHSSVERLIRLVNNFTTYSQIRFMIDQIKNEPILLSGHPFDAGALVSEIATAYATKHHREEDIRCEIQKNAMMTISQTYMEKALTEIISNAFEFSEPGTTVWVRAAVREQGCYYVVEIEDAGRGMAPQQIELLEDTFIAFIQFDRERYEQQGTGQGTALAKSIVELYGGTFSIASQVGVGTTVTLSFPLQSSHQDSLYHNKEYKHQQNAIAIE